MNSATELEQSRANLVMVQAAPYNAEAPPQALLETVTPTDLHYVRSNFALPDHDGKLHIGGAVSNPLTLTLDELRSNPAVTLTMTMECAGNGRLDMKPLPIGEPWGGYAVSTSTWTGTPLSGLLQAAAPDAKAVEVVFEGADHGPYYQYTDIQFIRSLPFDLTIDSTADILVAYEMNGGPLNADHGAPFRLIVPHWYGVASVKWLSRINVVTEPYQGEFQTAHYMYEWPDRPREPVNIMLVRARITDPAPGLTIPYGPYTLRGKAWSGTGPVTKVEVSFTGEGEWYIAELSPPIGPYVWQDWSYTWTPSKTGRHSIRARATDAAGNLQPDVPPWNRLGYGNNAVEVSYVEVR
jgi:DMSO/TMAO reductase YedYZ molybdopterin-dependent catalytic subunit